MNGPGSCNPCSSGGSGCACGCCEGTPPLTPLPIANRPGLEALSYRIGTHSSFLETMRSRLSSQAFPSLAALRTRDSADASLALLDAWATVADVLTFYQERIANESYLRTATERRSVLELARLVGYAPRPGVAASTYLAYALDEGPETRIPAGAAVRSVPRPGEQPQTFETSDELVARAAWNLLPIRLSRPQQPEKLAADPLRPEPRGSAPLYLKGIATNLKVNDPLLICTGQPVPELFRVLAVAPDGAHDRTRLEVKPWWQAPAPTHYPVASTTPAAQPSLRVELRERLASASDLETLKIARGGTAQRVLSQLDPVEAAIAAEAGDDELRAAVAAVLPELRREHAAAAEKKATRLEPWIGGLIASLEALPVAGAGARSKPSAAAPATEIVPGARATAGAGAAGVATPAPTGPQTTTLAKVLDSLGKRPAAQVRSAAHLERDAGQLYSESSDLAPRLLAAARPDLAGVLYQAWGQLPATPPPVLKICKLQTRAAVFGHNAPREPRRNAEGIIVGTKEWDLALAGAASEAFELRFSFGGNEGSLVVDAQVTLDGVSAGTDETLVEGQTRRLNSPDPNESIELTAVRVPRQGTLPLELRVAFQQRGLEIVIEAEDFEERFANYRVRSTGAPPTEIAITTHMFSSALAEVQVRGTLRPATGETEAADVVFLDNAYPQISPAEETGACGAGFIVLQRPESDPQVSPLVVARVIEAAEQSRSAYGITGKTTQVQLDRNWLRPQDSFAAIRGTTVFAQCEELELAEEPIDPIAEALCGSEIELAGLYDGLQPGRWVIVTGSRVDAGEMERTTGRLKVPVRGVPGAELAMLAAVHQGISRYRTTPAGSAALSPDLPYFDLDTGTEKDLPGDRPHTTLILSRRLTYCYQRDTVKIYGNVVKATHGETRFEVLGSGDAARPNQAFPLKQPPLTFVSAPTPSGIASTLEARVNDLLWHPAECPAGLGPADRRYFLRHDDGGATTVVFGDGRRGARLPTGAENVRARYRSGLGAEGNLEAGQLSQLATRPLGVKEVINPLPATGGAGRESRDQARRNAPLAVLALDRLVSVQDYADFARTFAGVGKSSATRISDGRLELVHLTIAGEDDIPIAEDSDLFRNLREALLRFGEPRQPLMVALRRRAFLMVQAEVRILPDYLWEKVEPRIRAAMAFSFGFDRRELGQDVLLSEVYRTVQGVEGVDHLDIDMLAAVDPENLASLSGVLASDSYRSRLPPARLAARLAGHGEKGEIEAAELLYFSPAVADTLILKERKS